MALNFSSILKGKSLQSLLADAKQKKLEKEKLAAAPKTWTPWTAQNMFDPATLQANQQNLSLGITPTVAPKVSTMGFRSGMPMAGNLQLVGQQGEPQQQMMQQKRRGLNAWQGMGQMGQQRPMSMNQNMFSGATPWAQQG